MDKLREELLSEIESFREKGIEFLNENISKMEFKHISCGFGIYSERNKKTFVIRLRIPSGIMDIEELRWVYEKAEEYGLKRIHLTTRESVQLHNLSIDDVCSIMRDGIEKNIFTRGAGGDYPRNVAMSPLAGVDKFEAFDVTPYAIAVNYYFLRKITSYNLPRKIKISFSSSNMDLGHCNVTDLGFLAVKKDEKEYFKVYLGGGLGQNPKLGIQYDELIEPKDVLYHVEAMAQLFMDEGDYDNRARARIRYIVERMGKDEFIKIYKKYLNQVMESEDLTLHLEPARYTKEGIETAIKTKRLIEQKQKGLYSVYFHPIGGQLSLKDLKEILEAIEGIEDIQLRLTMTEGIYFRNLNGKEAEMLINLTEGRGGETHLEQSISCIGIPTCQVGILDSQDQLRNIIDYFREKGLNKDILPRVHISGCMNSCGIHQACLIGLTGRKKKVDGELKDVFELHINGSFEDDNARLGKIYGVIPKEDIPEFLYELALLIEPKNINFHEYIEQHEDEFNKLVEKYIR